MKKIVLMFLCLFLLVGCTGTNDNGSIKNKNTDTSALKNPEIKWCQLYNPNGYDTVTCVISNPNSVDIDITYDLVFYKEGKEVTRLEYYSNNNVSSSHDAVIWSNVDVPLSSKVDDVKMENIKVSKAYYESVNGEIKYEETIEDVAYFSVNFDTEPTLGNIWIFKYKDENNNKKCDSGELVIAEFHNVLKKETSISTDINIDYNGLIGDSFEIYYDAYVE